MITGISPNSYHMQVPAQQGKLAELSEPQKEVWKDFSIEDESTADLGGQDRASDLTISPAEAPLFNLFSFNACRCSSVDQDMNAAPFEAFMEDGRVAADENDLMTVASALSDDGSHTTEESILENKVDGNSYPNHEVLPDGSYINNNLSDAYLEKPVPDSKFYSGSSADNIVNLSRELLGENSPMTSEWLSEHLGVAKLISTFPEFASFLNENSDLTINFMKSLEEVKSTLADFFNQNTVEKASELLSDNSPITSEWLDENLNAAHFIAANPTFAAYLQENLEQAEKFISLSA